MKRSGGLFDDWCKVSNFYEAFKEVRKGKTKHPSMIFFERHLPIHLNNLVTEIRNGTYRTRSYRNFTVYEPKKRIISAPHLRDRIVQHALMRSINRLIDKRFIEQSFACRQNKGTHRCSKQLIKYLKSFNETEDYCLKIDVSKFFYSIDRKILMNKVNKIIKCKKTLNVIEKFIFIDDNKEDKGIPIGNLTSQLFANLMLNDIDHYAKRVLKCKYYLRYMDDIVVLDKSKNKLRLVFDEIEKKMKEGNLKLNPKSGIFRIKQGVDFVGYRTWKNKRIIRKQSLFRIRKSLKKEFNPNSISSFLSHAKDTNSLPYVKKQINKFGGYYEF